MGNKSSAIESEVQNLFKATSLAELQTKIDRLLHLPMQLEDIYYLVQPQYVRTGIDQQFEQFSFLFYYLVNTVKNLTRQVKTLTQEQQGLMKNTLMLLTKFIPVLFEPAYAEQCQKLLWCSSNQQVSVGQKHVKGGLRLTLIHVNEEEADIDQKQELWPSLLVLVEILLNLCFWPGFTVLPLNEQSLFSLEHDPGLCGFLKSVWDKSKERVNLKFVWRGFDSLTKYPNDKKNFTENRIIVLQCLMACFGQSLFKQKTFLYDVPIEQSPTPQQSQQNSTPEKVQHMQDKHYSEEQIEEVKYPTLENEKKVLSLTSPMQQQKFKYQNIALLYFCSLQGVPLKEFFISLWGTILCHKLNFFWFQDNALFVQREPRMLASLCTQVLLFMLSETCDANEIARQINFNKELSVAYELLVEKSSYQRKSQQKIDQEELKLKDCQQIKLEANNSINMSTIIAECEQVFKNTVREALLEVESIDFFGKSIKRLLENSQYPLIEESKVLTLRGRDYECVQECMAILLFCYQTNINSIKALCEYQQNEIVLLRMHLELLIYFQIKYIEEECPFNLYLLCLETLTTLSRYERFSVLMTQTATLSFPTKLAPTIAGTFGDYLIHLFSFCITQHYQDRMKYFSVVYEMRQIKLGSLKNYRPDLICLLLCHISLSIKNISQQAAYQLAQSFYVHFNYDYLFLESISFQNFELLSITINNIICNEVMGNAALTLELIRNQIGLKRFLKFKVGCEQLKLFFKKCEKAKNYWLTPQEKRKKVEIIIQKQLPRPQSHLPTENSELQNVPQLNLSQQNLSQQNLELQSKRSESKESPVSLTEQEQDLFDVLIIQWEPTFKRNSFGSKIVERLRTYLFQVSNLTVQQQLNPGSTSLEQIIHILRLNSWLGLMDRSLCMTSIQRPEHSQQEMNTRFREFVFTNSISHNAWQPYFDPNQCQYFKEQQ